MSKIKLSYQDEQAIKEFESEVLDEEMKKEMIKYEQMMQKDLGARFVPWNICMTEHKESIVSKIRNKFRLQFV